MAHNSMISEYHGAWYDGVPAILVKHRPPDENCLTAHTVLIVQGLREPIIVAPGFDVGIEYSCDRNGIGTLRTFRASVGREPGFMETSG